MAYTQPDSIVPREFIIPNDNGSIATNQPAISGALFLSGANIFFMLGNTPQKITSAAS